MAFFTFSSHLIGPSRSQGEEQDKFYNQPFLFRYVKITQRYPKGSSTFSNQSILNQLVLLLNRRHTNFQIWICFSADLVLNEVFVFAVLFLIFKFGKYRIWRHTDVPHENTTWKCFVLLVFLCCIILWNNAKFKWW